MQFSKSVPTTILSSLVLITSHGAKAQDADQQGWYLKPTLALSQMSDQTVNTTGVGALDGSGNAALSSGFASGLVLGYDYGSRWSAELGWEYRSNGSEVSLADGQRFNDGNYASNTFFINALYGFAEGQVWQPYAGFGLSFIQEIDIDLETPTAELSYAGDGDTGFQVFAGVERELAAQWSLVGEVRYTRFSGIELTGENTVGTMGGLDYTPLSLQLGVKFRF